jgi:phage/plasmid-like protein (TIGR03299 family)
MATDTVTRIEYHEDMATIASYRQPAWRGLGTTFTKRVSTQKMMDLAHLSNWNLRLESLSELLPGYSFVKPQFLPVRDNPFIPGQKDVLGNVGDRYQQLSNEDLFGFGEMLLEGRERHWETAGAFNGGTKVFATLATDDDIILDPNGQADAIKKYLLLYTTHDGSSTIIAKKTNVRVDCMNTLNVALRGIGDEFKCRHTKNMEQRMRDAKHALGFAKNYDEKFEAEVQAMIQTQMTKDKFLELVSEIYPKPEDNTRGRLRKWDYKVDALETIWNDGTKSVSNLDDTAWKALTVLTEHQQWLREIRADKKDNFFAAGAGFDNVTNDNRNKLWERVLSKV